MSRARAPQLDGDIVDLPQGGVLLLSPPIELCRKAMDDGRREPSLLFYLGVSIDAQGLEDGIALEPCEQ